MKKFLSRMIQKNKIGRRIFYKIRNKSFPGSAAYWEDRYFNGGNSGQGSYGDYSLYKSRILNSFIKEENIQSVIEFGCGDGNQLKQCQFPSFIGLDVSPQAIRKCIKMYKEDHTKSFFLYDPFCFADNSNLFSKELALSLDVIYHVVEDEIFEAYMHHLFKAGSRYVIIYAWDIEGKSSFHVRHRKFTEWIKTNITDFRLLKVVENESKGRFCDFFIYKRL